MKTIEINIYKFSELSEEAKEYAINKWREDQYNYQPWFIEEANKTLEKFMDLFCISNYQIDYEEPYRNDYSIKLEDDILQLSSQRLATYIWNNYKGELYKGKYFSLWSKKDVSYKYYKDGYPVLKQKHSKIQMDNCCTLTGMCYDDDVLKPICDFLSNPSDINFETLLNDCIYSLCHSVSSEIEHQNTDESIIENIEANEYDFLESGEMA